jgi:hypothetical protein
VFRAAYNYDAKTFKKVESLLKVFGEISGWFVFDFAAL